MRNLSIISHSLVEKRLNLEKSFSSKSELEATLQSSLLLLKVLRDGTLIEGDELIGSIDGGIFAADLSPNGSQLLLLTGLQSLIILSTDSWEVINEAPLSSLLRLNNENSPLDAIDKIVNHDEESSLSGGESEAYIAWRFDAQRFAITAMDAITNRRVLRIFSADTLTLKAEGRVEDPAPPHPSSARKLPPPPEPLLLHGPVSWNFDGSLVATAQRLLNPIDVLQIAFFEANGLRHRELVLARGQHAKSLYVDQLQWAPEGNTILIVLAERSISCPHCGEKPSSSPSSSSSTLSTLSSRLVQIFHRDNYTWDLKFERRFEASCCSSKRHHSPLLHHFLKTAEWDAGYPHRLRLTTHTFTSEFVEELDFMWIYSVGEGCESSCVATIGETGTIRLSPFSMAQVPPPMAFSTLFVLDEAQQPLNVVSLALLAQASGETIAAAKAESSSTVLALLTSSGHFAILPISFFSHAECKKRMLLDNSLSDEPSDPVEIGASLFLAVGDDDDGGVCDVKGGVAASLQNLCLPNSTTKVPFYDLRQLTWLSFSASSKTSSIDAYFTCVVSLVDSAANQRDDKLNDIDESTDHILVLRISSTGSTNKDSIASIVNCVPVPQIYGNVRLIVRPVQASFDEPPSSSTPFFSSEKASNTSMTSVIHTSDGSIFSFSFNASQSTSRLDLISNLKEPCSYLIATSLPSPVEEGNLTVIGVGSRTNELLLSCSSSSSSNDIPPLQLWPSCGSISWHGRGHLLYVALGATPALRILSLSQLAQVSMGQPLSCLGGVDDDRLDSETRGVDPVEAEYAGTVSSIGSECVLENGARLVACASSQDLVVLQAPRGNIETIVPVTLSLCRIRAMLDSRPTPRLGAALELVRLMRIDMNILCDHRQGRVFANASWLREAVRDVAAECAKTAVGSQNVLKKARSGYGFDRWDMFLAALSEEDVCEKATGKYAPPEVMNEATNEDELCNQISSFASASASEWLSADEVFLLTSSSKVNRICSSLRSALLFSMAEEVDDSVPKNRESIYWQHPLALSVISSYARQSPADLERVLLTVQKVAEAEISSTGKPSKLRLTDLGDKLICVTGDAALSHAITVCDSSIELLYTAALGLYDLRLAHTLAQRGQQDPKEYVPFLASLVRLSQPRPSDKTVMTQDLSLGQLRSRIAVDIHLGRWGLAMQWCLQLSFLRGYQLLNEDAARSSRTLINLEDGPESLVSAAIEHPAETALSIAYTYPSLYSKLVGHLKTSATVVSGRKELLRAALLAQSWSIAAGASTPLSEAQIADQLLSQGIQREILSSPCLQSLVSACPDGLVGAVRAADEANICAAIQSFLKIESPPAYLEALCLASAHPGVLADPVLSGGIANICDHIVPAFNQQSDRGGNDDSKGEKCLLVHIALYLLSQKELRVNVGGVNDPPTTEWTQAFIMDMSKRLLNNTRNNDARLAGTRVLLKFFGTREADDGIEALCDLERWDEARAAAVVCNRSADLIPRVEERFADACAESLRSISDAIDDWKTNLDKLSICRALQKELGVGIGHSATGKDHDDDEDGASAAQSVVSFVSTASSKSSGTFSHLSRNSDTQRLTSRSSTLRLGGGGGRGGGGGGMDELQFGSNTSKRDGESKSSGRRREKQARARPGSVTEEKELLESLQRIKSIALDERYAQLGLLNADVKKKLSELQFAVNSSGDLMTSSTRI